MMSFSQKLPSLTPSQWLLLGTLVAAASTPYIVVGPLPLWLGLGIGCFLLGVLERGALGRIRRLPGLRTIISAWVLLVLATLVLDVVGYAERDVLVGPLLSFLTLLVFVGAFLASSRSRPDAILLTILILVLVQALFSFLQYAGVSWAWRFAETLISTLPLQNAAALLQDGAEVEFGAVGRVKGTHALVHVYNGAVSAIVAICIYVALNPLRGLGEAPWFRTLIKAVALTGAAAVLLSFSRSGLLAITGAVAMAFIVRPGATKLAGVIAGALGLLLILYYLDYSEALQFDRMFSGEDNMNNRIRLIHMAHSISTFTQSPLAGASGIPGAVELELPIHSVPLRYLNDYGLIGGTLYCCVLGPIVYILVRQIRSPYPELVFWGGVGLCLILALVADSWTHSSGFLRRDIVHALLLGIVLGQVGRARTIRFGTVNRAQPPKRSNPLRLRGVQ